MSVRKGPSYEAAIVESDAMRGRGADLLVEALVRAGVRELFGVPGDTGVTFYDALSLRTGDIRHVLARDERHAVAMADAYARATGRAGVVEVSSGGGTTYAIGGLGEAFASGVPMLVVASDIHRGSRGTGALTEIDQEALFSAVTKHAFVVSRAGEIGTIVEKALRTATTGCPGPVALIVPEDVLDEQLTGAMPVSEDRLSVPGERSAAPKAEIQTAARALSAADRPAMLVGGGVHFSRSYRGVAALAERIGAGVATSIHGKGAISDGNPWALGVAGNNGGNALANGSLADADTVLIVGSRANATDTDSFSAPPRSAAVIAIDVDPARIARNYPQALLLAGDAEVVLDQILAALPERGKAVSARRSTLADRRALHSVRPIVTTPPDMLLVDDVVDALAGVFADRDPIVVADPGAPTPAVADRWPVRRAGRDIIVPRGHGPMGYAIPGAIGAAIAQPDRPVLAMTGDGSFAMSCGELETIVRLNLPIITVQFTNHSLGWIKMLQHLYQGERYFGVDPGPIDAVAVARACGLVAVRPKTIDDLCDLVLTALNNETPLYVDVEVPHMIDVVPQVPAWHKALAGDRTRPVY